MIYTSEYRYPPPDRMQSYNLTYPFNFMRNDYSSVDLGIHEIVPSSQMTAREFNNHIQSFMKEAEAIKNNSIAFNFTHSVNYESIITINRLRTVRIYSASQR